MRDLPNDLTVVTPETVSLWAGNPPKLVGFVTDLTIRLAFDGGVRVDTTRTVRRCAGVALPTTQVVREVPAALFVREGELHVILTTPEGAVLCGDDPAGASRSGAAAEPDDMADQDTQPFVKLGA